VTRKRRVIDVSDPSRPRVVAEGSRPIPIPGAGRELLRLRDGARRAARVEGDLRDALKPFEDIAKGFADVIAEILDGFTGKLGGLAQAGLIGYTLYKITRREAQRGGKRG
jgi:hypothetical protein